MKSHMTTQETRSQVTRRPAAVAGHFYPAQAAVLSKQVQDLLSVADNSLAPHEVAQTDWPKAIIAPHAGYIYSGGVAASAYVRLRPARGTVTRVILAGPCHRVPVDGIALPTVTEFETPMGSLKLDANTLSKLAEHPLCHWSDRAHKDEHALEVHLPFIQAVLGPHVDIVPLVVGRIAPQIMQQVLEQLWGGPETVVIISSDLSHFLDYAAARRIDQRTTQAIERLRPDLIEDAGACGRMPLKGLLLQAQKRQLQVTTLDVKNSGDTAGSKDRVVGYGAWMLKRISEVQSNLTADDKATLMKAAWQSLDYALTHEGRQPQVALESFSKVLQADQASFVTLEKNGVLRGCIGSLKAHQPLAVDVAQNAIKAGFQDPRFPQLMPLEMPHLTLSISILSASEEMNFTDEADALSRLRPSVDGVIIRDGRHQSVFLPHVWEALPDPYEFMAKLKQKAGLAPDYWSKTMKIFQFTTETFSEESPFAA